MINNILEQFEIEEINHNDDDEIVDVSVWCVTYNHVAYIKQTIEGVLRQKTKYKYRMVIFDDASNDGTTEIIREYAEKYPQIIQAFIAKKNLYKHEKRQYIYQTIKRSCLTGKYIALCEGDDFWFHNLKLEKQISFLEENTDYSMVVHNAVVFEEGKKNYRYNIADECDVDLSKILRSEICIATASMIIRRDIYFMDSVFYGKDGVDDFKMKCYCAIKGKIHYFPIAMSVYRYNTNSSWSKRRRTDYEFALIHLLGQIRFLKQFNIYTDGTFLEEIESSAAKYANMAFDDESIRVIYNIFPIWEKLMQDESKRELLEEIGRYHGVPYMRMITDDFWIRKRVVIWGAGDYAKFLTRELLDKSKKVDAYVVSDLSGKNVFSNRRVYSFENLPLDLTNSEYVLLIAIREINITDAVKKLKEIGVKNYCFPFLFNMNNYHKCSFLYEEKT